MFSRRFGAAIVVLAMSRVALTRFLNWQRWLVVETAGARSVQSRFFLDRQMASSRTIRRKSPPASAPTSCSDPSSTSRRRIRSARAPGVDARDCTDLDAQPLKHRTSYLTASSRLWVPFLIIEASMLLWVLREAEVPMASELPRRTSSMLWQRSGGLARV